MKLTKEFMELNFPIAVSFARSLREAFGDRVRLRGGGENGKTFGKPVDLSGDWGNAIIYPDYNKKAALKKRK
jgi:hypothetical protein